MNYGLEEPEAPQPVEVPVTDQPETLESPVV